MKKLLVGRKVLAFDFGDGETVATYYDGHKTTHCYFDIQQNRQKLYSSVFRTGNKYSLESGSKLLLNIKRKLLDIHRNTADKSSVAVKNAEADFKGFIRCVVDAIAAFNQGIAISDCALLYAYPSSFNAKSPEQGVGMKSVYIGLIESVLSEYNPISIHSIDEAEACFYCKGSSSANCLIIDAGSSTLDFALFVNGQKIQLPRMSNSTLGASTIEESLYDIFNEGEFESNVAVIDSLYGDGFTRPYLVRALREKKERAYTKHQFRKLGSYKLSDDVPLNNSYLRYSTFDMPSFKDSEGNLMDFNLLPEIQEYRNDVKRAIKKSKRGGRKPSGNVREGCQSGHTLRWCFINGMVAN